MEQTNENRRKEYQARSNEIISVFSKLFLQDIDDKITAHLEMQVQDGIDDTPSLYKWSDKDLV